MEDPMDSGDKISHSRRGINRFRTARQPVDTIGDDTIPLPVNDLTRSAYTGQSPMENILQFFDEKN